jgi:lipoprotein-anchoring transpeptidase ErfK/SrfK
MARAARALVLALALVAVGCSRTATRHVIDAAPPPTTGAPIPVTAPALVPVTTPPLPPARALVATARVPKVKVFEVPGADVPRSSLANPNEFDQLLVFLVRTVQPDWLEVMLPVRPNGASGWVRASDVALSEDEWRHQGALGAHRLTVWKGADVVRQETVAVGMPDAPTPTGDYYVTELLDTGNPSGPYGPWAFGLSAFSDVYTSFAGGPGQIGLHGTNSPGGLGHDVSHGCVRVTNEAIRALADQLPIGTPISIVA